MHPSHYHVRRILDGGRAVVLPSLVFFLALKLFACSPARLTPPLLASFILFWSIARGIYSNFVHRWEANQLGAKPIPCVVGKWPGNLDILFKMMRAFNTSYVLDVYLDLFEEYRCTTLNLRILWADHVSLFCTEHGFESSTESLRNLVFVFRISF